jgi:DNA (cytosine-5)-methyltransferase 1
MRYGSVCSGIEAASVAWEPLGWTPAWFCEIDPFPSAVLAHHYPEVPNYGDFTQLIDPAHHVHGEPPIDLLVGGTPCQAFSVAGLRAGLADPRGGLTLEFLRLARALRPKWIVWENVPGVLSQDGGRAFGAFLGGLEDLGYGWAYRVLDAQYARVDGYPGAVPQRRRRVFVVACARGDFARAAAVLFEPEGVRRDSPPRRASRKGAAADAAGGFEVRDDAHAAPVTLAFKPGQSEAAGATFVTEEFAPTLQAQNNGSTAVPAVMQAMSVRRITPLESERLQGFPDDYTRIPWRGKPAEECPDGGRYKALGNSMACNVMRWLGRRIELVEACDAR